MIYFRRIVTVMSESAAIAIAEAAAVVLNENNVLNADNDTLLTSSGGEGLRESASS